MPIAHLRPLSFGDILDGAFALYRRYFLTLFITALIPMALITLATGTLAYRAISTGSRAAPPDVPLWFLPVLLISGVGFALLWAALTRETSQAVTGGEVSVGDGFHSGFRALLPLIGAAILVYVLILVLTIGLGIISALVIPAGGAVAAGMLAVIFVLGFLVLGLLVFAAFFAVVPAIVVERRGPWAALKRSWQLSRGARLRILGITFVSGLIVALPTIGVMTAAGMGSTMYDPNAAASLSEGQFLFQQIAGLFSYALTFPLFVACLVLLYYDRRVRTEAYDLELAAADLAPAE